MIRSLGNSGPTPTEARLRIFSENLGSTYPSMRQTRLFVIARSRSVAHLLASCEKIREVHFQDVGRQLRKHIPAHHRRGREGRKSFKELNLILASVSFVLWCPLSPCCGIVICSERPLIIPDRRYRLLFLMSDSPLRSEDIWRSEQQLLKEPCNFEHRQGPCVSGQSRAKGITCYSSSVTGDHSK